MDLVLAVNNTTKKRKKKSMKKILLTLALVGINSFFAGDFAGRQNPPVPQQQILGVLAVQAAGGGHQIQMLEQKFPSQKSENKQRKQREKAVTSTNQKYPKKRTNAVGEPRKG